MAITPRQERFIQEYLTNGNNASKAALVAGYSEKTAPAQGSRLLDHPEVKKAIDDSRKSVAERLGLTHEFIVDFWKKAIDRGSEMRPVLNRKGQQVYVTGPNGEPIAAFSQVDMKSASKCSELAAKHLRMLSEKVELSTPEGETVRITPTTPEQAAEAYRRAIKEA